MPTVDELAAQVTALAQQNQMLLSRIRDLEESIDGHVGIDYGAAQQLAPHPMMQVNTAEFGGGLMRLDRYGQQIKTNGSLLQAIYWLYDFSESPGNVTPRLQLLGLGGVDAATGAQGRLQAVTGNPIPSATVEVNSATASSLVTLQAANTGSTTEVQVYADTGANGYVYIGAPLLTSAVTSDYAALSDGEIWYRSDTDKLRLRANGATENLATESYVGSNALAATRGNWKVFYSDGSGVFTELALGNSGEVLTSAGASSAPSFAAPSGATVKTEQMITPWSWRAIGGQMIGWGLGAPSSVAWQSANLAVYVPFTLDESTTFTKGFWYNGATVSGNVDVGIYNEAGTKQVSIGSTAQATINVIQEVNIADTTLAAGRYYMALSCDNATSTFFGFFPGVERGKSFALAQQATAFSLPATATLAALSGTPVLPYFGFSIRTLVA